MVTTPVNATLQSYASEDVRMTMKLMRSMEKWKRIGPVVNMPANAPYSKKSICIIGRIGTSYGWENGDWVYLETRCGRSLKHHPRDRNCLLPKATPTCLGCLAE